MTYQTPALTLVGTANAVVLAKIDEQLHFDGAVSGPQYDTSLFVEAEW
jgi:hypothetical protein